MVSQDNCYLVILIKITDIPIGFFQVTDTPFPTWTIQLVRTRKH